MRIHQSESENVGGNGGSTEQPQLANATDDIWVNWRNAPEPPEMLDAAQRALERNPQDARAQADMVRLLLKRLAHDPFVAFVAQNENNYVVTFRKSRPILVPKSRSEAEVFPPEHRAQGERTLGLVGWMAIGLLPAGLGALLLFPVVFKNTFQILIASNSSPRDSRRALLALGLASFLVFAGAILALIFILHLLD